MREARTADVPGEPVPPAAVTMPPALTPRAALDLAIGLARRGPLTGPNPRVGCVVLAPSESTDARPDAAPRPVLAVGWHEGAGTPHAEAAAIASARGRGVDLTGATAVVTLEPCDHTGRTGPCSEALIAAGVGEVRYAVADPNPVATGGARRLREAGVRVVGPLESAPGDTSTPASPSSVPPGHPPDGAPSPRPASWTAGPAHDLIRVWATSVRLGRPYVTLKLAASLDGRVAARDGSSRWITSAESRAHAHAFRTQVDAIAVGTGTALADDPSLTARPEPLGTGTPARDAQAPSAPHQPLRVIVGNREVPGGARLRSPDGGELVHLRTHDPAAVLAALHEREVRHVLVEGGPTLASAFLAAGLVDEVHAYVAPVLLGAGPTAVHDLGIGSIGQALRLEPRETRALGPDVLIVADLGAPTTDTAPPRQES